MDLNSTIHTLAQPFNGLSLIVRSKTKIGVLELDACVKEGHGMRATATSHPVEAEPGQVSEISDHVKIEPRTLRIDGVITNTPASVAGGSVLSALALFTEDFTSGNYNPVGDAYAQLEEYLLKAKSVTVVTTLKTYYDMVFLQVDVDRDAAKGNSLHFSATLSQIFKVRSKEEKVTTRVPEKNTKAKGKKIKAKKEGDKDLYATGFKELFGVGAHPGAR